MTRTIMAVLCCVTVGCTTNNGSSPNDFVSVYRDTGALCEPLSMDFVPEDTESTQYELWPSCPEAEAGQYIRFTESISSIARIASFERIAALLFNTDASPSEQDFLQARLEYQIDEGLDSRVIRRYDPHFTAPEGINCGEPGIPDRFAEYCIGPSHLQPMLLAAFNGGIQGAPSLRQAARIEAGLLWFLYASVYKESLTCVDSVQDCDSAYAYFTGGESYCAPDDAECTSSAITERGQPARGLARYIQDLSPSIYDRAWDGMLAMRCWRQNDNPGGVSSNSEMREQARAQFDRALLAGMIEIIRDRLQQLSSLSEGSEEYIAAWTFVQFLGPVLYPVVQSREPEQFEGYQEALMSAVLSMEHITTVEQTLDAIAACL